MERKSKHITLSVDFDGVIRNNMTKEPIEGVHKALEWLYSRDIDIIISTANHDLEGVKKWLADHDLGQYPVTDKKVAATAYIDDRAIRFTNWNDITSYF